MPVYKLLIKEQSGNDLVDYQIRIQLENTGFTDWANLTADSIYFTDANGNPLYFWIEYLDTVNKRSVIWVKIPSIPKNSTVVINLNYGGLNPYPSYHDPKNVFVFFDHFDNPMETLTIESCTWSRDPANSIINVSGSKDCIAWKDVGLSNVKVIARLRKNITTVDFGTLNRMYKPSATTIYLIYTYHINLNSRLSIAKNIGYWTEVAYVSYSITTGAWYRWLVSLYGSNIVFKAYNDNFTGEGTVSASITELTDKTGYGIFVYTSTSGDNLASFDYFGVAKHIDPDPAVIGENQSLAVGSIYYDYQSEIFAIGSIYYNGVEALNLGSIYYDGIEALKLGSIYYDGIVGLNLGSIYYDGIEGLSLGSIYYDGITGLNIGSIYYDGIEAVAPPTLPPQILCPEFADILSQEGYSWEKAIASLLCGLEAVLTELGNEISRSAKTIGLVFIGVGFGYVLMRTGEKIIKLILRGLRKSYEKKR